RCAACVQNGGVSSVKSSHSALSRARASALLFAPTTQAALIDPIDTPVTTLSAIRRPCAANSSLNSSRAFKAPHSEAPSAPPPCRTTPTSTSLFDDADMTSRASELTHHVLPEPVDRPLAGERNERDLARLPRFKAHRGAGGDIEPHAARLLAIEFQRRIGLEEMIMRADLDRPIAGISDRQRHRLAASVDLDLVVLDEHFTGDHSAASATLSTLRERLVHRIGSCTVTSLVPSGNVASTWMSWIISAMPSITSPRVSTCAPASISSATVLPSRAPSTMKSVMSATASG